MALSKRIIASDEELGKRNDGYKPAPAPRSSGSWSRVRAPLRWRKKRLLSALIIGVLLWAVLYRLPPNLRKNPFTGSPIGRMDLSMDPEEPTGPPPRDVAPMVDGEKRYYEGLIRFFRLASSLHKISQTSGYQTTNRNILFAAASLKSASALIPMACEMARWDRNYVHLAIMGRDDLPIQDILDVNGVTTACKVFWHDARPDYTEYSTDLRAAASLSAAMNHINNYMHPQAIIVDDSEEEEPWFVAEMHLKARKLNHPVITIPAHATEKLMWITHLDAGSLKNWHKPAIDILIHAPAQGSGSLIRLLKSLQQADYTGFAPPHITVELPADIDPPTEVFLQSMQWPPLSKMKPGQSRAQLSVRRRIPNRKSGPVESSSRFIESFYPTSDSHILVLAPQAEISPSYFHYLLFLLLEYRYSSFGYSDTYREHLAGISLESPSSYLNGTSPFQAPHMKDLNSKGYTKDQAKMEIPFLWEAPNSNAALYFADKWREIHSFMTNRIRTERRKRRPTARRKLVSQNLPAWTEYFLELMRARGYNLLYPARLATEAFVTVHTDLYQPPEEFTDTAAEHDEEGSKMEPEFEKDSFLPPVEPAAVISSHEDLSSTAVYTPLHRLLPFEADLPDLPDLPYLTYSAHLLPPTSIFEHYEVFADEFRRKIGGCDLDADPRKRILVPGSARDLFCFGDEKDEDYVDDEPLSAEEIRELHSWRDPNRVK